MQNFIEKAKAIKLLILDVDGVLTDGKVYITDTGSEYKGFYIRDGLGIKMLLDSGVKVAIITGRYSKAVEYRLHALGVTDIYQGQDDKVIAFNELKNKYNLSNDNVAYLGDDLPDLNVMKHVGLKLAVADADSLVKKQVDWVTTLSGGRGAVREVCELLMQAQGTLFDTQQRFLA